MRAVAFFAAALILSVCFPLSVYADVVTDTPVLSGGSENTGSGSGAVVIAAPGSDNAAGSSGSSTGCIITDAPVIGGSENNDADAGEKSSGSSGISVSVEAPGSAESDSGTAAPDTKTSETEFGKAPETAAGSSVQAPASSETSSETSSGTSASAAVETVTGPGSVTGNSAGSVYANSAVTRINLDFSLITPTHTKGSLNVARGSVALSDGSWQDFDYDDNIHFAFYRMKDVRTDSSGTKWYIATVKARRFGDTYTTDGELKTELWLNASDCITRSTIDISTTNPTRIAIVKAALAALGKQYIYGGNGPDAYDCSGLVQYVCKQAGITVPRTSTQLLSLSGQITAAELRPGDLMVRAGHCGIYIGNGIFIHASDSSVGVVAEYLSVYNLSNKFTNYVNVVGD